MLEDTFANRLKKALDYNNMRPIDLSNKTKISKAQICNYLKGKYKAKQDKLYIIAKTLNVSEAWLMGYDVDMNRELISDDKENSSTKDNEISETEEIIKLLNDLDKEKKEVIKEVVINLIKTFK